MSEVKKHTADSLKKVSRPELRRIAAKVYGLDHNTCTDMTSGELRDYILEQQDGGGGGKKTTRTARKAKTEEKPKEKEKADSKPSGGRSLRTRPSRGGSKKKADPEPETEPETEPEGAEEDGVVSGMVSEELLERLDALGGGLDDTREEIKEDLKAVMESLDDIKRNQFIQYGILLDIHEQIEGIDTDERVEQLEGQWEEMGSDEGNE